MDVLKGSTINDLPLAWLLEGTVHQFTSYQIMKLNEEGTDGM